MEELLQNALEPEETVLWTGKCGSFETLDCVHKKDFTVKVIVAASIALALTAAYLIAIWGQRVNLVMILLFFLLASIAPLNILSDAGKLRKITYLATDRRLLVMRDSVKGMPYEKILCARLFKDEAGCVSLVCGNGGFKTKPRKLREAAVIGPVMVEEGEMVCDRLVFYNVDDVAGLKKILKDKLPCLEA